MLCCVDMKTLNLNNKTIRYESSGKRNMEGCCTVVVREASSSVLSRPWFYNASATNIRINPDFPLFSVTQTIILVFKEKTCKPPDKTPMELKNPVIVNKLFRGE